MENNTKLYLAWLYYDLLELYGDRGNIKILEHIAKLNKIELVIDQITINDERDISNYDILFLGGGSDYAQSIIFQDLLNRKNQIEQFMNNKGFILTICGGYQMFGKYYVGANNEKIDGLRIYDFYTESSNERCIGNVVIESKLNDKKIKVVGFENHGGQTFNVKNPFGKILVGNGNEHNGNYEGCLEVGFIGTYLHGPLLPKNLEIGKYIFEDVLKRKYNINKEIKIDTIKYSENAKKIVIQREL